MVMSAISDRNILQLAEFASYLSDTNAIKGEYGTSCSVFL
jgi:hypothetical protein